VVELESRLTCLDDGVKTGERQQCSLEAWIARPAESSACGPGQNGSVRFFRPVDAISKMTPCVPTPTLPTFEEYGSAHTNDENRAIRLAVPARHCCSSEICGGTCQVAAGGSTPQPVARMTPFWDQESRRYQSPVPLSSAPQRHIRQRGVEICRRHSDQIVDLVVSLPFGSDTLGSIPAAPNSGACNIKHMARIMLCPKCLVSTLLTQTNRSRMCLDEWHLRFNFRLTFRRMKMKKFGLAQALVLAGGVLGSVGFLGHAAHAPRKQTRRQIVQGMQLNENSYKEQKIA
jgi:hypothetical protein